MSALANRPFVKMNGLGNEIVIVDLRGEEVLISAAEARAASQAAGSQYDQLMTLQTSRSAGTVAYVRIYNSDGSEAGACGNGMRCVAEFVYRESGKPDLMFETKAGLISCRRAEGFSHWTVDMGKPRFGWQEIPLAKPFDDTRAIALDLAVPGAPMLSRPSALSMGNPHAIFWVEDVGRYDLGKLGPLLESHPLFPERANISLAQVITCDRLRVRTWERGAGLTRACGSAACAAAVAAARLERVSRKVTVTLPGGDLAVEWHVGDDHVLMSGPVEFEHEGRFDPQAFAQLGAA